MNFYKVYMGLSGHGYPDSQMDCHEIEANNERMLFVKLRK